ncbi:MAG: hypothetical protein U0269_16915 [Polyangiales bacterium]
MSRRHNQARGIFSMIAGLSLVASASAADAATLRVGAGQMYTTLGAALTASRDGDVVEIVAGTYREEVVIARNNLTIRAADGGRVIFDRTGMPVTAQGGKGIFIVDGANATIEGIEFVGAECTSNNGAGIRWQGTGTLTVRRCVFRDNQNGILGGNNAANIAVIENNEFIGNGRGDLGFTHNLYINEIAELRFVGNWTHALYTAGADVGHLLKSRARANYVLYNRITAENNYSSYEIQLTGGGLAYIIGNVIQQGPMSRNSGIISIGGDGTQHPDVGVYIVNNTIVNDLGRGNFVTVNAHPMLPVRIVNNFIVGMGTLISGGTPTMMNNVMSTAPGFVNAATYDYHLMMGSPAVNAGINAGMGGAFSLVAANEYAHPRSTVTRMMVGAIDVGAYEFGSMGTDAGVVIDAAAPADSGVAPVDSGVAPPQDSGGNPADSGGNPADSGVAPPQDSGGVVAMDAGSQSDGGSSSRDAAATGDGGGPAMNPGGCGCRVAAPRTSGPRALGALAIIALATAGTARRRRRGVSSRS